MLLSVLIAGHDRDTLLDDLLKQRGELIQCCDVWVVTRVYLKVTAQIMDANSALREPSMAEVWARGLDNFDALTDPEKVQMIAFLQSYLRAVEVAFFYASDNRLDLRVWDSIVRHLGTLYSTPGVQKLWELRKDAYSGEFQDFVDGIERKPYRLT